ncbi:SNF2-related protein [Anopheles sinensis]|uniref:SNF2-related protein n=1 Tax=Anopheles sinensis TaxID=74873 RepID=A0A084VZJ9_ANOSI|nr:SNF2-related protein [Anopheles sinensis]
MRRADTRTGNDWADDALEVNTTPGGRLSASQSTVMAHLPEPSDGGSRQNTGLDQYASEMHIFCPVRNGNPGGSQPNGYGCQGCIEENAKYSGE